MSTNPLQVGVDFNQKRVDLCLLAPDGQVLVKHRAFGNSRPGFAQAKQLLLETIQTHAYDGLDLSGEATSYY